MEINPIAVFHSPLSEKFGIPRQSGLAASLRGSVELLEEFRSPQALKGLDGFDYMWLIWGFDRNRNSGAGLTVRPPRLGGNEKIGVFASRSPYRPNALGLSAVRIVSVDCRVGRIEVLGADLADGTPIYDIKPYVEYADSRTNVRSGFVDSHEWKELDVVLDPSVEALFDSRDRAALVEILAQDPRPGYHDDAQRIYGLRFGGHELRFTVADGILTVLPLT